MNSEQKAIKTTYFSIIGNAFLAIIKGIAGVLGHSYALIADAIESTADVLSSFLVLLGFKYAEKPADSNHPYGHGKIEPLVTFMVVGFLIVSAVVIAYQSIHNIQNPHPLPKVWTLFVLAPIIVWKEISFHYVMKRGQETDSTSLKADAWHHRSDAIISVLAFVGISIALITGEETADDWAALVASVIIVFNSYKIFRPALGEMMDEQVYDKLIDKIRAIALTVEGIIDTEKCFVRKSGLKYHVDLHATVDGQVSVKKGHDLAHNLQDKLKEEIPQIERVLIHIEPDDIVNSNRKN